MSEYQLPEILRKPLEELVLQVKVSVHVVFMYVCMLFLLAPLWRVEALLSTVKMNYLNSYSSASECVGDVTNCGIIEISYIHNIVSLIYLNNSALLQN